MNDGIGLFDLERRLYILFITKIALNEMSSWIDRSTVATLEIIKYDHLMIGIAQHLVVTLSSDISSSTRN